jgi:NADPH-dependent glutamate synthase beta subunit-like oxidoreductase
VIVIGGGNSAVDAARTALRLGAEQVVIVCLEDLGEMAAITGEIQAARSEGVDIKTRTEVRRLVPGGVELGRVELEGDTFRLDRIRPVDAPRVELAAELVIVAAGQSPERLVQAEGGDPGSELEWTEQGLLAAHPETGATSHPRVFACGDLASERHSVTDAIAAGQRAAAGIDLALRGREAAGGRRPPPFPKAPSSSGGMAGRRERSARHEPPLLPEASRRRNFDEVAGAFSESEARKEADRCRICGQCGNCSACIETFGCPAFYLQDGLIKIDEALCVGCGVCVTFCPNGAISVKANGPGVPE